MWLLWIVVSKNPQSPWLPFEPIQAHHFMVSAIIWFVEILTSQRENRVFWFCRRCLGPVKNSCLMRKELTCRNAPSSLPPLRLPTRHNDWWSLGPEMCCWMPMLLDWGGSNWTLATPCPLFSSSPFSPSTTYCQSGNDTTINCDNLCISWFEWWKF